MRFIKKLIFILILLLISFFVYRLISPKAANQLLHDLKTVSNDKIGTHFILTGDSVVVTGILIDTTGAILQNTGGLQEITGNDILLLNDAQSSGEDFTTGATDTGIKLPTPVPTPLPQALPSTPKAISPKITSSNGLSSQDTRDLNTVLKNFGN